MSRPFLPVIDRIERNFIPEPNTGCWLWLGYVTAKGYGRLMIHKRPYEVYRVYYELVVGKVPEGLVLDHLCRVPSCINPQHLEPVTRAENIMRGYGACAVHARKTVCPRCGSEYGRNAGGRVCIPCNREASRRLWHERYKFHEGK